MTPNKATKPIRRLFAEQSPPGDLVRHAFEYDNEHYLILKIRCTGTIYVSCRRLTGSRADMSCTRNIGFLT
jgi:hypothetical protein